MTIFYGPLWIILLFNTFCYMKIVFYILLNKIEKCHSEKTLPVPYYSIYLLDMGYNIEN